MKVEDKIDTVTVFINNPITKEDLEELTQDITITENAGIIVAWSSFTIEADKYLNILKTNILLSQKYKIIKVHVTDSCQYLDLYLRE